MMGTDRHAFVVVANRLPVDRIDGAWETSPGGLVSAVAPVVREQAGAWVGWANTHDDSLEPFDFDGMSLVPVSLSHDEHQQYYEGFCNATLWPLHHDLIVAPQYHRSWWRAYREVNARFAQAAVEAAETGATVWVHDYHLQLVPAMIRAQRPDIRIGYFCHIPFPPVEQVAQLPWRDEILRGLLGADVIGLQGEADAAKARQAMQKLLGMDPEELRGRVGSYPISIDVDEIRAAAESPGVQETARCFRRDLGDPATLMIGVDRLDYSKGILHRLWAFEELIDDGLLDAQGTRLAQIAVPSREGVRAYQDLRDEVEHAVGRINGRLSTLGGDVIHYSYHSHSTEEAVALYLAADILLVTSLRDGMNLVAKEFVTARRGRGGALVLSEFAGAAEELDQAIIVNPHDRAGLKAAIHHAATLSEDEARRRMDAMADTVAAFDVRRWAQAFLHDLRDPASAAALSPSDW
ncbi:alpha,alpha-trehalose-phosphate synthase (UDP-forming) [Brevibacterium pigmentatum]|uniref:alpha,alpha-trehalose-phosphate synthase (UDP-forming) n=1 Tax=Brevibacterium pigmentatum TaxID=1496080 RepID=UPI001D1949A1|nr:trehalose-6-phosphate synthase [Brevibacterium pigmentatum]